MSLMFTQAHMVMGNINLCNHCVVKLHEATQVFMMVDYVREMTVRRSCKYGEYGSLKHMLFLLSSFLSFLLSLSSFLLSLSSLSPSPSVYSYMGHQFLTDLTIADGMYYMRFEGATLGLKFCRHHHHYHHHHQCIITLVNCS